MKTLARRTMLLAGAFAAGAVGLFWTGQIPVGGKTTLVSRAEAIVGRPATPVSYAGVARRSTVGVGAGGVGGPASGVGVLPGAGAGQAGVGYSGGVGVNLGGPVNRVGVR